ncbi:MAG: asparagine synthase-related protein, partial [Pseudomonadota bacterium]
DAQGLLSRAVAAMDQPSHDGLNTYAISEAIHNAGLKVAVSGQGSDELFLGYPQRHGFPRFARTAALGPRQIAGLLHGLGRMGSRGVDSKIGKLAGVVGARRPLAGAYLGMHSVFSYAAVQRLRGEARPHPERFVEAVSADDPLDALSRLQLRHYLKDTLLRDADQMSMAHSLELRAPFVDHDLVELALTVPARHKLDPERNKPLLLDAVGQSLPREVWDRPKQGFAMPVGRWLLEGASVFEGDGVPGLSAEAVAAVRREFVQGGRPYGYVRTWTLEVLGAWLARHGVSG